MGNKKKPGNPATRPPQPDPDKPLVIVWQGEPFRVAAKIGMMPMLTFGKLAEQGVDALDMEALAAMHDLIEGCLADDQEWVRFKTHATKMRADEDDILDVVRLTIEALSGRPTLRPSDSSAGPQPTNESSTDDSSLRVIERLAGRPDLQLQVWEAQQQERAPGLRAV